jgi:hypothetical protein
MNKEPIRALTEYVISNRKEDEMNIVEVCCLIQEWFEQNPQNPVAQQPQFAIDLLDALQKLVDANLNGSLFVVADAVSNAKSVITKATGGEK